MATKLFRRDYGAGHYRHCEPTGRRKAPPMTGSAKQSSFSPQSWISSSLRSSQ
jgi:hypothetical protein